jgi:IclR family transcriptional regulator, KDG regulon repressor
MSDETDPKGTTIQSLARAFSILDTIGQYRDGVALADLSRAVGLHNSTAFHLTRTLVGLGCIAQDPDTKRYRIGPKIFSLAASAFDEVEFARLVEPFLEELAMRSGETSHLAIRSGSQVVVIARCEPDSPFRITERTGMSRPVHATALGKILLSSMTEENFELLLSGLILDPLTTKTITNAGVLRREVEQARLHGVAYDDGEFHLEVRCVAVPVRTFTGQQKGALGMSAPIYRLSLGDLEKRVTMLREISDRISEALGAASPGRELPSPGRKPRGRKPRNARGADDT